jgi:hypothetical protein
VQHFQRVARQVERRQSPRKCLLNSMMSPPLQQQQ